MFEDVSFTWQGETKTIPSNRILRAIAAVEEIITIVELSKYTSAEAIPMGRIAQAYGTLLRFAGFVVTDEEIYVSMFGEESAKSIPAAIHGLLAVMIPPSQRSSGEGVPKNSPATAANMSRKRTRQRS